VRDRRDPPRGRADVEGLGQKGRTFAGVETRLARPAGAQQVVDARSKPANQVLDERERRRRQHRLVRRRSRRNDLDCFPRVHGVHVCPPTEPDFLKAAVGFRPPPPSTSLTGTQHQPRRGA
jgi:hypothetical protein